jgi:Ca2+/Na+ antiporter
MAQPAYQYTAPPAAAPAQTVRTWSPGLVVRIVLTLLGAAGMIVGAFLRWIHGITGVQLDARALWRTEFLSTSTFVRTVGFAVIVLGLLAIVGLAPRSGWLTRLAGVLGIVAFVLFTIELYRTPGRQFPDPGAWVGAWMALAGSIVALIAGFFGSRSVLVSRTPTVVR